MKLISTNPARNYIPLGVVNVSSSEEIENKVRMAAQVKESWRYLGIKKRKQILLHVLENFKLHKDELVNLITSEIGKPIKETIQEFDTFFLQAYEWFLSNCERSLQPQIVYNDGKILNSIVYEPYGITAVIMPWNFPLEMFVWGVIPNLLVGNTVVMKHSEYCPLTAKVIESIMYESELPQGVFNMIYGDGQIGEGLVKSDIDLLWFTGSSKTGKYLFSVIGNKQKFIKSVMELGGSNPGIVFDDVEIDKYVDFIVSKRFLNCGQACNALKRLIVHHSIFDETVQKLTDKVKKLHTGDPTDANTDIGSLVSKTQLDKVKKQVDESISKGAKIVIGGKQPENLKGAYFLPTILVNITSNMPVWQEEVFAPVLPVIQFQTEEEATKLANNTKYGLGAHIFTKDKSRFERLSGRIQSGMVRLNDSPQDYSAPFGGFKMSGIGREHGELGFQELTQIKVIAIEK